MRTSNGVARWQMDIKPEDLNRGNNLVSRQQGAHPNIFVSVGANGTVTGTRSASALR
jgi:hypothetical protein